MARPRVENNFILTPEQVASAPEEVRRWLHSLYGDDNRLERAFVLERNGAASSGDGLAICTSLEVKSLLHRLSDDFLSCQILFALGCDYYIQATGEHRGHPVQLNDFLHHTDAQNIFDVERALDAINAALRHLRRDRDATIYRTDGQGYFHVDGRTQHTIHQLWRRLLGLTASRRDATATFARQSGSDAAA